VKNGFYIGKQNEKEQKNKADTRNPLLATQALTRVLTAIIFSIQPFFLHIPDR
jgi:hypothetical protein